MYSDVAQREYLIFFLSKYSVGKSRLTVVHMENSALFNNNTRINSVFHVLTNLKPTFVHPVLGLNMCH